MNRALLVYAFVYVIIELAIIEGLTSLGKTRLFNRDIKHACTGNNKFQGTIESTNVYLTWKRNRIAKDSNPKVALHCSSCRVPNGNNAEFLINNRSDDSITYNTATGKCTHRQGECFPDLCRCTSDGNEFIRYYPLKDIGPMTDISCDMRFVDTSKSMKFSKLSTLYFDGQEFHYKDTVTHMTTPIDDNLNGNTGYKEALLWVGIISATILLVTVILVLRFHHRKRNKKKKKCDNDRGSTLDEKKCDNDRGSTSDEKKCDNDRGSTLDGSCQLVRFVKDLSVNLSTGSQQTFESTVTVEKKWDNDRGSTLDGSCQLVRFVKDPSVNLSTGSQLTFESTVTVGNRRDSNSRIFVEWARRLNPCQNEPLLTYSGGKQKPTESAVTVYKHVQKYTQDSRQRKLSEEFHQESHALIGDIQSVSSSQIKLHCEIINDGNNAQAAVAKSAGAQVPLSGKSFDILFINFETKAEDDWVEDATKILENECNLTCGCAQFGDDSFKYTGESTTIIMTFSEKSSNRKPAIFSVIDYIQSVVVVLVETCYIPIQRHHMKCVDATKGGKEWRNQLLTALGFKP